MPVKRTALAKSRLRGSVASRRAALALAFAEDAVAAVLRCPVVALTVVVTDDHLAAVRLSGSGAVVVPDEPHAGLNAALRHGAAEARARRPGCGVAAVQSDLPALTPDALAAALRAASAHEHAFVADAAGTGTTLYAAGCDAPFEPRFGPGSRAAHEAAGAVPLADAGLTVLRADVDTEDDLWRAVTLGVGPSTARLLGV